MMTLGLTAILSQKPALFITSYNHQEVVKTISKLNKAFMYMKPHVAP